MYTLIHIAYTHVFQCSMSEIIKFSTFVNANNSFFFILWHGDEERVTEVNWLNFEY